MTTSALRVIVLFAAIWGLLHGLSRVLGIAPDWPHWAVAAVLAAVAELILYLYRYESSAVEPRRARQLILLRLAALAVLAWILVSPSWTRKVTREQQREVVVVIDDSASMHLTDEGQQNTRQQLGETALEEAGILEKLGEKLRVRTVRAARSIRKEGEEVAEGWGDSTDLASALGAVLDQVPPVDLAGVLMLSDGRHNRPVRVEDVARRFGILDAPVGIVAVGSADPPKDAAVIAVRAPEAIHLGDRMRVAADLKFDGYKGKSAKVSLRRGDEVIEEREIPIPQDHHREEIRFALVPEQGGVGDYRVEIGSLEKESFEDNNAWDFETSITDARTNVLIIEGLPRWEFRYLRNLFYGRDKSVHLQHVLLSPDRIDGQDDPEIPASAGRPFGEALATRLPANEEEWRKFDVIILGDVPPETLDEATWEIVSRCVNERAALLVMIAGPRHMPHAIGSETGRALVPAELDWGRRNYFAEGGEPFQPVLTSEGRDHPITRQSSGESLNEQIWASFPEFQWRHPIKGLKDGAEVLITAAHGKAKAEMDSAAGLNEALDALSQRRAREADSALLVTRQTGKGKVALLLTDRTWRLREGAGDIHHHRFWGNLVRWGAGPTLRSGGRCVRLGTDQLTYTPDDRPLVTARLRDTSLGPVTDDSLRAEILLDGKVIDSVPLTAVEGSNGLHEARLGHFKDAGRYRIRLRGERADSLAAEDGRPVTDTGFRVVGSRGPVELAETTLNLPLLQTIADLSGGRVVAPDKAGELAGLFLTEKDEREELRETTLWDNGWVLALFSILLGAEWVMRRASGLP